MSDDIVKRLLREIISAPDINGGRRMVPLNPDGPDGAAEIERLRAEVARLTRERDTADSSGYTDGLHDGAQQGFQQAIAETGERLDVVTRLRAEVERLDQRQTDLLEANNRYLEKARTAERERDEARQECAGWNTEAIKARVERDAAERKVEKLREALTVMVEDTQKWCSAVQNDSSWDGWDHHYKTMCWKTLPAIRATLAETEKE